MTMLSKGVENLIEDIDYSDIPELTENLPLKKTGDKEMDDLFAWGAQQGRKSIPDNAVETATEIQKTIAPNGEPSPQQGYLPCCPMPTDLCRVSPFFPMAKDDLKDRDYLRNMVITSSSWGDILYTGPRLSTYEEDALAALLAFFDAHRHFVGESDGKPTYCYQGPLLPILKLMGIKRPNNDEYKRVIESFELLLSAVMKIAVNKRTARGKSVKRVLDMANILSHAKWDEEKQRISLTINPYFYEIFGKGQYTLLDLEARNKLKSPTAKSMYRFSSSHQGDVWEGNFMTLAATLNLDLKQYTSEIKKRISGAGKELIKNGLLSSRSKTEKQFDIIRLQRPVRKPRKIK